MNLKNFEFNVFFQEILVVLCYHADNVCHSLPILLNKSEKLNFSFQYYNSFILKVLPHWTCIMVHESEWFTPGSGKVIHDHKGLNKMDACSHWFSILMIFFKNEASNFSSCFSVNTLHLNVHSFYLKKYAVARIPYFKNSLTYILLWQFLKQ